MCRSLRRVERAWRRDTSEEVSSRLRVFVVVFKVRTATTLTALCKRLGEYRNVSDAEAHLAADGVEGRRRHHCAAAPRRDKSSRYRMGHDGRRIGAEAACF